MNYKVKKVFWYLVLLFLFSSLCLTDQFNSIGSVAISIMTLMIIPIVLVIKKKKFKIHKPSLFLMYIFLIVCSLSALYNSDLKLIINAGMMFVLYLAALAIIPSYENIEINKLVYKAILVSNIPIILVPILISGFNFVPYRGIFYNPNSFGSISATLFTAVFSLFIFKFEQSIVTKKHSVKNLLIQLLVLFSLFFLIVLSGSRTSTLSAGIVIVAGIFFLIIRLIKVKKLWSSMTKGILYSFIGFSIVTLLIKFTPFYDYLYINILYKFERKVGNGDVLDQRGAVWTQTIKDSGLWGNGSSFFTTQTDIAAHNTFINILGQTGWPSLIIFLSFLILACFISFKYAISEIDDQYKYLPLMLIICFCTLSMGESMIMKLSMIAMFFSLGSMIGFKKRILKQTQEKKKYHEIKVRRRWKLVW